LASFEKDLFSCFECGPNVHAKILGAKALASRKLCRVRRKVLIKIVGMCEYELKWPLH